MREARHFASWVMWIKERRLIAILIVCLALPLAFMRGVTGVEAQETSLPYIEVVRSDVNATHEIAWSPDGSIIALAADNSIWLYDDTLQEIAQLDGHTDDVMSIDWNADGTRLASASLDETIRIWNMEEGSGFGTTETVLQGHTDWVIGVRWNPEGTKLASIALDSTLTPLDFAGSFYSVWVWDVASEQVERVFPSYAGSIALAWSPDGNSLTTAGAIRGDSPAARIWDVETASLSHRFPTGEMMVSNVAWNSNGELLAIGSDWPFVLVANVNQQNYLMELSSLGPAITVDWSQDDTKLAAGDYYGNLIVWDVATAQVLAEVEGAHAGLILMVEWSPVGTTIASVSSIDNALRIWDVRSLTIPIGVPTVTPIPTETPRPTTTVSP